MRQRLDAMVNQIEAETADQKENAAQGRIPAGFCTLTCPVYKWDTFRCGAEIVSFRRRGRSRCVSALHSMEVIRHRAREEHGNAKSFLSAVSE